MFLHETKRIKAMSLKDFIYNNSLERYNEEFSENYCPADSTSNFLIADETTLRKYRHRLLSTRKVYNKSPQWAAIRKDSEHEWTFYYTLDVVDDNLIDTYKRIGNLYNDINSELNSIKDDTYKDRLENAYKKFLSKLKKLKYTNFLELQKEILSHICENDKYYGINIYRFEKELRLYAITNEVKSLLKCKDSFEEMELLLKFSALDNIYFPKLSKDFSFLSISDIIYCTKIFSFFIDFVIGSSRLIIDELIEKNFFEEDWEELFLSIINKMTKNVFYNFEEIDFTVSPESNEKFMKIMSYPINCLLFQETGIRFQ